MPPIASALGALAIDLGRTCADEVITFKVEDRCEAALGFFL
jgi:hypothetical protein